MSEISRKLVLAFDCDDVLVQTSHALLDAYNEAFGTEVPYEGFYSDSLWGAPSADIAMRRVDDMLRSGVMADIVPDAATVAAVKRVAAMGHELHVVTGRQSYQEQETINLLDTYYPGIFHTIEHTNMYASGENLHLRRSKGEVCRNIGAHMLIDDHIVHGNAVLTAGVEDVIVYGSYPWNQFVSLEQGMMRCETMNDVEREVAYLSTRRRDDQ